MESQRNQKRRSLFEAQDQVDRQRDELIAQIEGKLQQRVESDQMVMIRWKIEAEERRKPECPRMSFAGIFKKSALWKKSSCRSDQRKETNQGEKFTLRDESQGSKHNEFRERYGLQMETR
ncbi:hypothetical protein JWG42_07900 [Desulfoprunum benzoelyticum]|uniref:hypothetical protein n=1 Tax=Desulfoprunum benzoelyticum TaxID=1506996 RepID=UPI0019642A0F|nr:hypothetical protein [Desulfoprunum benzoelyticum]MBM9530068.1 hypothetical protein [Desulfoprunum benzoelyticum]